MTYGNWGATSPYGGAYESRLRQELDRLFEEFGVSRNGSSWIPSVDVCEMKDELRIDFELPGIRPEDIEVTVENGILCVRGEKRAEDGGGTDARYHMTERTHGTFSRSFTLPRGVEESEITADFGDGVLHVHIPKNALDQPRRIEIGERTRDASPKAIAARSEDSRGKDSRGEDSRARDSRGERERSGTSPRARGRNAREADGDGNGADRRQTRMAAQGRSGE